MLERFIKDTNALLNPFVLIVLIIYFGRIMYTDWKYRKIENKANLAIVLLRLPLILLGFKWEWSYLGASIAFFLIFLISAMLMYVNMDGDIKAVGALGLYFNIISGATLIFGAMLISLAATMIFRKKFPLKRFPYGVALGITFLIMIIVSLIL